MSVQKLLGEADKFLEKGKVPDAIAKIKAALTEEPLNQIVATKLANLLVQERQPAEAAKVYGGLAKRLSDAGKNQVAIAIFKQALDLTPDNIDLRMRFAQECESVGKLGDAFLQGQIVLNHYLRRKKFFDASNILPLMARAQPKDEKIKLAWVEVLQMCQAEQKLIHLLVALCGPPGVVSQEFPQGGDPATLSPALYEGLKKLVPFFPRDPKVAYALAWAAFRRGQMKEFYGFLRECLRREPDFCLAMLLFARVLAEEKKLNESLFVFKYYKERMTADKSADMLTLNRLMEAFVEKNGWIKFVEDSGDSLDTPGFFRVMTGVEQKPEEKAAAEMKEAEAEVEREKTKSLELPPAEIDLGGLPPANDDMELITATGQSIAEVKSVRKGTSATKDPLAMQAELIKATVEAAVAGLGAGQTQQTVVQPVILPAIQATAQQAALAGTPAPSAPAAKGAEPEKEVELPAAGPEGELQQTVSAKKPTAPKAPEAPPPAKAEPPKPASIPAADISGKFPVPDSEATGEVEGFKGETVNFTSLIKFDPSAPEFGDAAQAPAAPAAPSETDPNATRVAVQPPAEEKTIAGADDKTTMQPLQADAPTGQPGPEEVVEEVEEAEEEKPKKKLFNPMEQVMSDPGASSLRLEDAADERTEMFSPMEVLDAAKVMQNRDLNNVSTKAIPKEASPLLSAQPPGAPALPPSKESVEMPEGDKSRWRKLYVEGERTQEFSPVEAVQAGVNSRRPMDAVIKPGEAKPPMPPTPAQITPAVGAAAPEDATIVLPARAEAAPPPAPPAAPAGAAPEPQPDLAIQGDATVVMTAKPVDATTVMPAKPVDATTVMPPKPLDATVVTSSKPIDATSVMSTRAPGELDATMVVKTGEHTARVEPDPEAPEAGKSREIEVPGAAEAAASASVSASAASAPADVPKPANPSEGPAFMPIPTAAAVAKPGVDEDKVDMGTDLLEGPTRIFTQPTAADKTEHLIKEIKQDLKSKANARVNIDMLMKKAERYTAKRNYYLARKALRHAQALGADEELVKERLREIRKLELPEGLYNTISSDQTEAKVDTADVLERLEQEFELTEGEGSDEMGALIEKRIESIFQENDPRTILDFGVGLHEMGLFRQAEALFIRLVEEFPDHAFDAYYLAAISKLSRRDYAGAASILKRLSSDTAKSEQEKIQIYYALGETFEKMRQTDRSRKFYKKVAELDANYRNIRHKLDE